MSENAEKIIITKCRLSEKRAKLKILEEYNISKDGDAYF